MKTVATAFLATVVISSVGIWGCAQQKNNVQARKIRDLEARYVKLEEDSRAGAASLENTRKKLTRLELLQTHQMEELKAALAERDEMRQKAEDLRQKLVTRTTERDNVNSQLLQFSKELQSFASRVETAAIAQMNSPGSSPVAVPAQAKNN
jgi:outer membrane murein-binding lipoprotein Lpp